MNNYFEELFNKVKEYNPSADGVRLKQAYDFALLVHGDQKRLNKDPYIKHCLGVAFWLTKVRADDDTLIAALLHDILEYSNLKPKDLTADFGEGVSWLVEMVTETNPLDRSSGNPSENLRKMFLAMAKDVRVVLIRLAEKLDNLDVVDYFGENEKKNFCQRILDIYGPLAERLGIFVFKRELEDRAFKRSYPEEYSNIEKKLLVQQSEQEDFISNLKELLTNEMDKVGLDKVEIFGRAKSIYSIYKKIKKYQEQGKMEAEDVSKIYDQLAVTVLVKDVASCYSALGIVHNLFNHIPEEFDDYISRPKPNGYQAIQTTVFATAGKIVEIQIKTRDMHEYNEFGPASHVYYKMFGSSQKASETKIGWVKELASWQQGITSTEEFKEGLKLDFFADRIFCFTPKGDVMDLPVGATPVDFGYSVHSRMGNLIISARVNEKQVSLDHHLNNGDVVELVLSKDTKKVPNRDWLNFVVTTKAKKEIKKFYFK